MSNLRLLDLFCCAGGAAVGYARAGFDVAGVDIEPQPHYPFEFVQADALEYVAAHGHEYDAIHASPPCQAHTQLGRAHPHDDYFERHIDLIPQTRTALIASGKPYVIENVEGAPLIRPLVLCGAFFGLKVYRHRLFESNVPMTQPAHYPHRDSTPRSGRGHSPKGFISITGNGGAPNLPTGMTYMDYARYAMGIDWPISRAEISQAIPPIFTFFVGLQLLAFMQHGETAPLFAQVAP